MIGQGLKLTKSNKIYNLGTKPKGLGASTRKERTWRIRDARDQKSMPSCVGHATYHFLRSSPHANQSKQLTPNEIYFGAQRFDEWPGENYEGTSVSGAMNFLMNHPQIDINGFHKLETVEQLLAYVMDIGPVIAGTDWDDEMGIVNEKGFITVDNAFDVGGHAYLIYGAKIYMRWFETEYGDTDLEIDWDRSYFKILNSWGPNWGIKGTAKITFYDMNSLFNQYSEFLAPVKIV